MSTVLVTGASSGIGRETARQLADQGHSVIGAARRTEEMPAGITPVPMDLADPESIDAAFTHLALKGARVDALVHSAGYGHFLPLELTAPVDARRQLEVGVLGALDLTRRVLPGMRAGGAGRIVFVSSVASRFSSPAGGWYHASKAAIESLADTLRQEVRPFGIDVAVVQPGMVRTPWHAGALRDLRRATIGTDYDSIGAGTAEYHQRSAEGAMVSSVEDVASVVVRAATTARPRTRYPVGRGARTATALPRLLPDRAWDRLTAGQFAPREKR